MNKTLGRERNPTGEQATRSHSILFHRIDQSKVPCIFFDCNMIAYNQMKELTKTFKSTCGNSTRSFFFKTCKSKNINRMFLRNYCVETILINF